MGERTQKIKKRRHQSLDTVNLTRASSGLGCPAWWFVCLVWTEWVKIVSSKVKLMTRSSTWAEWRGSRWHQNRWNISPRQMQRLGVMSQLTFSFNAVEEMEREPSETNRELSMSFWIFGLSSCGPIGSQYRHAPHHPTKENLWEMTCCDGWAGGPTWNFGCRQWWPIWSGMRMNSRIVNLVDRAPLRPVWR